MKSLIAASLVSGLFALQGGMMPGPGSPASSGSGGGSGLLIQSLSSGAQTALEVAYGVRQLSSTYSGYAMQVQRVSDSTTLNVGFSSGNLNTSAITTFCASTTCGVSIWYDQSGNANNMVQSTLSAQPIVYTGGYLSYANGIPTMVFVGSQLLVNSAIPTFGTTNAVASVTTTSGSYNSIVSDTETCGGGCGYVMLTNSGTFGVFTGGTAYYPATPTAGALSVYEDTLTSTTAYVYLNGTSYGPSTSVWIPLGKGNMTLGGWTTSPGQLPLTGDESEILVFSSVISGTDLHTINLSQYAYYTITGI